MPTPQTFQILQQAELIGSIQFVGANAVGPQLTIILPNVLIKSSAAINLIHDEWGELSMEGDVLANIATGSFGTWTSPDTTLVSPNINGYYIGKGIVSWQPQGTVGYTDLGNVSKFEFQPEIKTLPHYSSRLGIKTKDAEVVQEKAATVKITMDEFTAFNMQLVIWESRRMVSLVDIAPDIASETITVLGKELQVWGIPNRVLAQLMRRFPELRKQMVGMEIPADEMLVGNIEMMPAIIAAGVGALGDADIEAAADRFPSDVQADLVKTIMRLTMPAGVTGPLAEGAAAPKPAHARHGAAPVTKSPQASSD